MASPNIEKLSRLWFAGQCCLAASVLEQVGACDANKPFLIINFVINLESFVSR